MLSEVNTLNELNAILDDNKDVIVVFEAPAWCQPCKRLKPHVVKASESINNQFVTVDIDKADSNMRAAYPIQSVPQVFLMRDGGEEIALVGRTSLALLREIEEQTK